MWTVRAGLAGVLCALAAAGCSSGGSAPQPATTAAKTSGVSASEVAVRLKHGLTGLTSAHLAVQAGAIGGTSDGEFSFAAGKATASQITLDQAGSKVEVITVGASSYAKLPRAQNTSGKPWIKVRSDSTNEFVRGLSASLALNQAVASLSDVVNLAGKAQSVRDRGNERIGGSATRHYSMTVVASGGVGSTGLEQELALLGNKPVPVDLWLDRSGRPVKIAVALPLGGQTFPVTVLGSRFNVPVKISAPRPDLVSSQ